MTAIRWTAGPSRARRRTPRESRDPTATTGSAEAAWGSRRGRPWRPTTRSTWASASRASPAPRRATRSWIARSTTCFADGRPRGGWTGPGTGYHALDRRGGDPGSGPGLARGVEERELDRDLVAGRARPVVD